MSLVLTPIFVVLGSPTPDATSFRCFNLPRPGGADTLFEFALGQSFVSMKAFLGYIAAPPPDATHLVLCEVGTRVCIGFGRQIDAKPQLDRIRLQWIARAQRAK